MATKYISPTGNDSTGDGSLALPWLTVAKAYTSSTTADTINVLAGTYTIANGQGLGNRTWQAYPTYAAVIWDWAGISKTITEFASTTTTFIDIRFQNFTGSFGNTQWGTNAIVTLTRCVFTNININSTWLFRCGQGYGDYQKWYFNYCLFYNITENASSYLIAQYNGSMNYFYYVGCIFHFTYASFFLGTYTASAFHYFTNCILYNTSGGSINTSAAAGVGSYMYNCCNYLMTAATGLPTKTNCITTDPLFIDPAGGNFNLRPTSPCIGTGTIV
jgi:hypothetical protein